MLVKYIFILSICRVVISQSDCLFTDSNGSGATINLQSLSSQILNATRSDGDYEENWTYSPCRNGQTCPDTGPNMVQETHCPCPDYCECYVISKWDEGMIQPVYNEQEQTFTFNYTNGQECIPTNENPRALTIEWKCNQQAIDPNITYVTAPELCQYFMHIESHLACNTEHECKWESPNGEKILDLSNIKDHLISKERCTLIISENENQRKPMQNEDDEKKEMNEDTPLYKKVVKKTREYNQQTALTEINTAVGKIARAIAGTVGTYASGGVLVPVLANQLKDAVLHVSWSVSDTKKTTREHFFEKDTYLFVEIMRHVQQTKKGIMGFINTTVSIDVEIKFIYVEAANNLAKKKLGKLSQDQVNSAFNYIENLKSDF